MWRITDNIIDKYFGEDRIPQFCSDDYTVDGPPLPDVFRLRDDDDYVYFIGVCDCLANDEFEPLDALKSAYGVTAIEYMIDGKWVRI